MSPRSSRNARSGAPRWRGARARSAARRMPVSRHTARIARDHAIDRRAHAVARRRLAGRAASARPCRRRAHRARARVRRRSPMRMPPDAIVVEPASHARDDRDRRRHAPVPQLLAERRGVAAIAARTASTATQLVPPAPATSTVCTPAPASARAACGDSPQPVSLTIIGSGDGIDEPRDRRDERRGSRGRRRSWISSWPGVQVDAHRVGADALARAR